MRVTFWTQESVPDVGAFVSAQDWPEALGAVAPETVRQLATIPIRSEARGGYFTIVTMDVSGDITGFDQVDFVEHARLEAESVVRFDPRVQELLNATRMDAQEGEAELFLAESRNLTNVDSFHDDERFLGLDGAGLAVAIVDTGIDSTHEFFQDRIVYAYDFYGNDEDAEDKRGHGTHVASIAAGYDEDPEDGDYSGVAPGADIVNLKVFPDEQNSGDTILNPGAVVVDPTAYTAAATADAGDAIYIVPGDSYYDYRSDPLAEILGGSLAEAYREYQAFMAEGGDPTQFTPSNPLLHVVSGMIGVRITALEPVVWQETIDGETVEFTNTAFLQELEAVGLEITGKSAYTVGGWLPIDALDQLAEVAGIRFVAPPSVGTTHDQSARATGSLPAGADQGDAGGQASSLPQPSMVIVGGGATTVIRDTAVPQTEADPTIDELTREAIGENKDGPMAKMGWDLTYLYFSSCKSLF